MDTIKLQLIFNSNSSIILSQNRSLFRAGKMKVLLKEDLDHAAVRLELTAAVIKVDNPFS